MVEAEVGLWRQTEEEVVEEVAAEVEAGEEVDWFSEVADDPRWSRLSRWMKKTV